MDRLLATANASKETERVDKGEFPESMGHTCHILNDD